MRDGRDLPESQARLVPAIVGADPREEQDEERDRDDHDPGAARELGDQEDDGADAGHHGAHAVQRRPPLPACGPLAPPVHHEPGLGAVSYTHLTLPTIYSV